MNFDVTDEQRAIRDTFRAFADREIAPQAEDLDANPRFPRELFLRAGEIGFFGMRYPEPEGSGADAVSYVLAVEELSRASMSVACACTMQSLMGTYFLHRYATGEVRERLLGPALRGEVVGTICMTEPEAGSDLGAIATTAVERDGRWFITGSKTWITSAPVADMFTGFARTGAERTLGIFLVERGATGLTVGRSIDKLGVRASITSEVAFDETPATCPLGDVHQGLPYLKEILAEIRVMTAALAVGVARAAYETALAYAAERKQFGRPINRFQAVQAHLAEMAVDVEAARQMTLWAACRVERDGPTPASAHDAAIAKLFASEASNRVCDRASRVLASYGYAKEFPVQRYLRDARFTLIGGGTSEILRSIIAKGLTT